MTRVLVTGAAGFVGRTLVPLLAARRDDVTALDLPDGDLSDPAVAAALLSPWRWDAVVHLAGPVTSGNEDLPTGIEVVGAHVRLALNVRRHLAPRTRVVHASSMTVYGDPVALPVREDQPRRPRHLYGLAKSLADDVWLSAPDVDAWVLRFPGLFSAARKGGALYHFCRAARAGEPLRIDAPSPTPWDILHVDDAAAAIVLALGAADPSPGALNIAYGEEVSLPSVAAFLAAHAGRGSTVESLPGVTHPPLALDITRAKQHLGWSPPSLRDRLARLYAELA